jgi:hypothetical protein
MRQTVVVDAHLGSGYRLAFGHGGQELGREFRQQAAGEDVVQVAGAVFL